MEQVPEVTGIVARTGSDELGLDPMGLNQTDSFLVLKPRDEWRMASKEELVDEIRTVLKSFPGIDYAFTQPIQMRVDEMLTGVRGDLVGFVEEARQRVAAQVQLPTGYYYEWGGEFENQQRAAQRLSVVVPVAVVLIFLLLFSTFGSVRQAVLVLTNVPFAMIGGIVGLWLTGEYLSVPASVGFIALLGIAVLNGVVMVTYFNQLKALGYSIGNLVVEGARRRLRPVLMTASIAAFGLVPLLFASGPGSEIQRPLAIVVIGGLISSTALTLILLPILYRRFGIATREA